MITDRRDFLKLLGLSVSGTLIEPKRIFYSFAAAPLIGDTLIIHRLGGEIDRIWVNPAAHIAKYGHPSRLVYIPLETGFSSIGWTCGEMGLDTAEAAERRRTSPYRIMSIDVLAKDELIRRVHAPEPYFGQLAIKMTAPNYR